MKFNHLNHSAPVNVRGVTAEHKDWLRDKVPDSVGPQMSMLKLTEEVGELAAAVYREYDLAAKDGVGDVCITLMSLCQRMGWDFEQCVCEAWRVVRQRNYK